MKKERYPRPETSVDNALERWENEGGRTVESQVSSHARRCENTTHRTTGDSEVFRSRKERSPRRERALVAVLDSS